MNDLYQQSSTVVATMSTTTPKINWNTDEIPTATPLSALVSIPDGRGATHELQLVATGPPRKPNQPVVIFEAGFPGDAYEFATVMRLVAEMGTARCFAYNRMGMQESDLRSDFKEDLAGLIEEETKAIEEGKESKEKGVENPKANEEEEGKKTGKTITALDCAKELSALLIAAGIPGPYVTAAHSWGGIIMCQLLALKNPPIPLNESQPNVSSSDPRDPNDRIVGMIFIDANQESSHDRRNIHRMMSAFQAISSIDQNKIFDYKARCVRSGGMTETEWRKCNDEKFWPLEWHLKQRIMVGAVIAAWDESISTLKSFKILKRMEDGFEPALTSNDPVTGKRRGGYVSAIWGKLQQEESQSLYDEAVKLGLGNEEERASLRILIDTLGNDERENQKGFMKLVQEGRGRFVDAEKSAHHVHKTEPELVAEEIRWVMEELAKD